MSAGAGPGGSFFGGIRGGLLGKGGDGLQVGQVADLHIVYSVLGPMRLYV